MMAISTLGGRERGLFWLPICAASLLLFAIFLWLNVPRYAIPVPITPWDAAAISEAHRILSGLPVYEKPSLSGHATWLYGPVVLWIEAAIFWVAGPSNHAGRMINAISAILVIALLLRVTMHQRSAIRATVYSAMLLSLNHFTLHWMASGNPDWLATLLAVGGLASFRRAVKRKSVAVLSASCLLFVTAFFTKQTLALFATAPFLMLFMRSVIRGEWPTFRALLWHGLPTVSVIASVALLAAALPEMFHYMVTVPGQYAYPLSSIAIAIWACLKYQALYLAFAIALEWPRLKSGLRSIATDDWLYVVAITFSALAVSVLSMSKEGGNLNSLLPFLLATVFLFILQVERNIDHFLPELQNRPALGGALVAMFLVIGSVPERLRQLFFDFTPDTGTRLEMKQRYEDVIRQVGQLEGMVYSPDDPTITLYAGKGFSRSIVTEMDAGAWKQNGVERVQVVGSDIVDFRPPQYFEDHLRAADYLVSARTWGPTLLNPTTLQRWGFVDTWHNENYRIWRKASIPITNASAQ